MSSAARRVVVTGMGCLTPAGLTVEDLWLAVQSKRCCVGPLTRFDPVGLKARHAGEVKQFQAADFFPHHKIKRLDRYAQFSLYAAEQAWRDAGLDNFSNAPRLDAGISFGSALGGIANAETAHERFLKEGASSIVPALALQVFGASAHSNLAIYFGLRGYGTTNSNSCAAGASALGDAFRQIREGRANLMLAGGAEAPLSPLTYGAFDALEAMAVVEQSEDACRPFDRRRTGFVMAEGAAVLVLEELGHARARGAKIYAEIAGYALNNDAYHMTSSLPGGESASAAMHNALAEAGVRPEEVGYINAHASATPMNDAHEAVALQKVFGKHTPPVSGTKGVHGHPLGAAGAIESVVCVKALTEKFLPATTGCEQPDAPEGVDVITGTGREKAVDVVMSNAFGFGGINAVLVFKRVV
jgi:3-oxoacyl-[acyl-carrier-protein] synthase II